MRADRIVGSPAPRPAAERRLALDALRGFALLGILVPNMPAFAWPQGGWLVEQWWNGVALQIMWVGFSGKFVFLFSLMFGAGVVLFDTPPRTAGARLWHRRCLGLLAIGLVHGYLIWFGDILVFYAVAGLAGLWWVRRLPGHLQLWAGLAVHLAAMAWLFAAYVPPQVLVNGPAQVSGYLGSWADAQSQRFAMTRANHLHLGPVFVPALWGAMLAGMGLTKLGVLTGERSLRFHTTLGVALVVLGGGLTAAGYFDVPVVRWRPIATTLGSVPLAIGYSQLVVALASTTMFRAPTRALAKVGRMALSNYLLQSLVCTTIMYGYGFGLFGSVQFPALFGLILGVWIVNIVFSIVWLRSFAVGPVEGLWRRATYG